MFSRRTAWPREPHEFARKLAAARAAGRPLLDLAETNPARTGLAWDAARLGELLADPDIGGHDPQPFGLPAARSAAAADLVRRGVAIGREHVLLTASTSEAYSHAFRLLCDPGDAVLVPQPGYPLLDDLAALDGLELVPYRLRFDGRWRLPVEELAMRLPERARAVVVVQPNNPTGSCLDGEEAAALAGLCRERGLALISDEVFADFPRPSDRPSDRPPDGHENRHENRHEDGHQDRHEDRPLPSLLPAAARAGALAIGLSGLSKSCGLPQLKLAWMALAGPEAAVGEAMARLEHVADAYLSVGTPVQLALPALLAEGPAWRARVAARLRANLAFLDAELAAGPVRVLPADGGWAAVLELPAGAGDEAFAIDLLERDGVVVQPGFLFGFTGAGHVVLSLLTESSTFAEGIRRLALAASRRPLAHGMIRP